MNEIEAVKPGRGRPANRQVHASAIREAEGKFADRLPEIADMMLELALGRKAEVCPFHHSVLRCDHEIEGTDTGFCDYKSKGVPANQRALEYTLNRIAGTPAPAGDKQINMEFVRKVTRHIADVFKSVNNMDDPEERARNFAMGVSQLWVLVGQGGED